MHACAGLHARSAAQCDAVSVSYGVAFSKEAILCASCCTFMQKDARLAQIQS